ncbi:hypothetical protein [Actinocorallia populi]|uniref:hypothetical protein n=1 Tax=Actinocorallia populi TaxID=2079200 RepID=UPI00130098F9|nr:hypothetical protein [Actinocorallia populi]
MRADFDRVYSPPEPPEPSHWRPRGWQVAFISFLLAAGGVFFAVPLLLDDSPEDGAMPTLTAEHENATEPPPDSPPESAAPEPEPSRPAEPSPAPSAPAGEGPLTELPKKVCDSVSEATFLKLVPKGEPEEYGGSRAGSCGYTSDGADDFRYLRLETRLADVTGDMDPITSAKWSFGQDYKMQEEDKITDTLLLEKVPGLGEEAFRRVYTEDGVANVTTARIAVRVQNLIVTGTYSRAFEKKPQEQQDACLEGALEVVKEALRSYT